MRILWFTWTPSLGGDFLKYKAVGNTWIESLERHLSQFEDIELGIAFLWNGEEKDPFKINNTWYYPVTPKLQAPKGRINKLISRWSHKIPLDENVESYLKVVHDFNPDIIQIFGTESDYGMILPELKMPCVVYIQGSLVLCTKKWYSGITENEVFKYSNKWRLIRGYGLIHDFYSFRKRAEREKMIFKNAKFIVGRTNWDKRLTGVLSPTARYFHCDEILREQYYAKQWQRENNTNQYVIISVIRSNIYKGFETIYECQNIFCNEFPDVEIKWKIAGATEGDEILILLKKKFKNNYNSLNIQLLGPLQEDDLINEMLNSDLFVHPSHIENSPNSMCEAMMLGMPVVATSVGGVPSLLTDGKEGLLVQDGDPYSMAGAILELKGDISYAKRLGSQARERAIVRHNPLKITEKIRSIYKSILTADKK